MTVQLSIREYKCPDCFNRFWVDCDDCDYPCFCPFCGNKQYDPEPGAEQPMRFEKNPVGNLVDLFVIKPEGACGDE